MQFHVLPGNLISIAYDAKIEKWEYMNALQTYVVNYLSSAKALIDLTRKHYEKYYEDQSLIEEYENKKQYFVNSNLHKFVEELRSYVLHYGAPPLSITKSINHIQNHKVTHRIELTKDILMKSGFKWTKKSRDFFDSDTWEDNRDIRDLFSAFFSKLKVFQNWYGLAQRDLFSKELNEIDQSKLEFKKQVLSKIVKHIDSGKGFSVKAVEAKLLRCFDMEEAKEIIAIENQKERVSEMLNRLRTAELIDAKEFVSLFILVVI